jgi:hypothetical protein
MIRSDDKNIELNNESFFMVFWENLEIILGALGYLIFRGVSVKLFRKF